MKHCNPTNTPQRAFSCKISDRRDAGVLQVLQESVLIALHAKSSRATRPAVGIAQRHNPYYLSQSQLNLWPMIAGLLPLPQRCNLAA